MAASTSSVLEAEFRRGLKDVQNAVLNPWNGVVATHEEAGTIANPTQQIVTQEIQGNSYQSMLESYAARGGEADRQQETEIER